LEQMKVQATNVASVTLSAMLLLSLGAWCHASSFVDTRPADPQFDFHKMQLRVHQAKRRVFDAKNRFTATHEVEVDAKPAAARVAIMHVEQTGWFYRLVRLQYAFDGAPIYSFVAAANESLVADEDNEVEVFEAPVVPGKHQLSLLVDYAGEGYGVLSYLDDYRFRVKSSHEIVVQDGITATVRVISYAIDDPTVQLSQRPAIRYEVSHAPTLYSSDPLDTLDRAAVRPAVENAAKETVNKISESSAND
jgi:hypothetical protein